MDDNDKRVAAKAWFEDLRDALCAALEKIEVEGDLSLYGDERPGCFEITPWRRGEADGEKDGGEKDGADEGGGQMGMLHGRVFEKAGVHVSTVHGQFTPEFAAQIPGAEEDPNFWASGISLIVHPRNPHVPAAHMNTRMIATRKTWFGGGGDLNPMHPDYRAPDHEDALTFKAAFREACEECASGDWEAFSAECDRYFWLPHRGEPRGVGGIFYDRMDTGDWGEDFAFTRRVGETFLEVYPEIVRQRLNQTWTPEDEARMLVQRGRYAEFNLLYDRGTTFGLKTGGNVDSILSSLPPRATWP